jgi:hypothetical protein
MGGFLGGRVGAGAGGGAGGRIWSENVPSCMNNQSSSSINDHPSASNLLSSFLNSSESVG